MSLFRHLGCLIGRHERSRSKAREINSVRHSVCKRCGVKMRQNRDRSWSVIR